MFGWFGKFSKKSTGSADESDDANQSLSQVNVRADANQNELEEERKALEKMRREAAKSSMAWYFDIEMEDLLRHFSQKIAL